MGNRSTKIKRTNGFTLVELLVAMTIISILTVVTIGQFQTAKRKANDVARKGDLNAVSKSLQMYFTDYGYFPQPSEIVWGDAFEDSTVNPPYVYMKKLPRENILSEPYCYKIDASGKKFGLFAQLENAIDKECDRNGNTKSDDKTYRCTDLSGTEHTYCYGVVSPNTALDSSGELL